MPNPAKMAVPWQISFTGLLCLLNAMISAQEMNMVPCVCNEGSPSDMFATANGNGPVVRQIDTNECIEIDLYGPSATQMMYPVIIGESRYYISKAEHIYVDSCQLIPWTNSAGTITYVLVAITTTQIPYETTTVVTITEAATTVTTHAPTTIEPLTDSTTESTTQAILSSTTVPTVLSTTQDTMTTKLATEKVCEHGWNLLDDSCYMFQGRQYSWLDANLFCQSNNGHLVYIESQNEQNLIANYIQHHPNIATAFWIGANDRLTEGDWRWDNPYGLDKHVTYTNWCYGAPNNHHDEDCVELIGHDMHWNDGHCEHGHGFICETATTDVVVTPASGNGGHCDDGWRPYNDHCYLFKTSAADRLTWSQAQSQCSSFGAYLVVISSTNEQNFIHYTLNDIIPHVVHDSIQSSLWIGATDYAREGHWQWVMGEQSINVAFTAWGPYEPNNNLNHNEDCAVVRGTHNYEWNDYPCDLTIHYICEKEKGSTEVIATPAPANWGHCDSEWRTYNGHCYLFKTSAEDTLTWSQAQSQCSMFGAYLVAIDSNNEQNFIHYSLNDIIPHVVHHDIQSSLWIGATDYAREGHWQWVMGEQSTNVAFTAWGPYEPNNNLNHNEDCAVVRGTHNYEWNDYPCNLHLHYICEKDEGSSLQPIVVG